MSSFKCKKCGAEIEVYSDAMVCTCDSCGEEQIVPKSALSSATEGFGLSKSDIYADINYARNDDGDFNFVTMEAKKKVNLKFVFAILSLFAAIIGGAVVALNKYILPNSRYNGEMAVLESAGKGDVVSYGNYKGELEWVVLDRTGDKLLLMLQTPIVNKPFHKYNDEDNWEKSTLRTWLNDKFYNRAFGKKERASILSTEVKAETNPKGKMNAGADTEDKVFILSKSEIDKLLSLQLRKCEEEWWLRSPGKYDGYTSTMNEDGEFDENGSESTDSLAVRPAIWVSVTSE